MIYELEDKVYNVIFLRTLKFHHIHSITTYKHDYFVQINPKDGAPKPVILSYPGFGSTLTKKSSGDKRLQCKQIQIGKKII